MSSFTSFDDVHFVGVLGINNSVMKSKFQESFFFKSCQKQTIPVGIKDPYLESSNASIDELMMTMVKWGNDGK